MQSPEVVESPLDLRPLAGAAPVAILKLNQGNALDWLKRNAGTHSGSPTITFQKDSATISIPLEDGTRQEAHFRIANESLPNLLVKHDHSGWSSIGYVTRKLHPKDWSRVGAGSSPNEEAMTILTKSQEVATVKKSRAVKKTSFDPPARSVPSIPVPKSLAKPTTHIRRMVDSDSSSSGSDSESEEEEDLPVISQRLGKRISTASHDVAPVASKKPRTTDVPNPNEEPKKQNSPPVENRHSPGSNSSQDSNNSQTLASKRPRSTAPQISAHLHSIEAVEIDPKLFPDISRDIHSFDEFDRSYKRYKDVWPLYIKLHGELVKNRADFDTLNETLKSRQQRGESSSEVETEIQELQEKRRSVVDPMQSAYAKLHNAMQVSRQQLETFSTKHLTQTSPSS